MKRIFAILALIGFIVVSTLHGLTVQNINRTPVVFVNGQNELTVVQLVSNGIMQGCDYDQIPTLCTNLRINTSNFRKVPMETGITYLQKMPDEMISKQEIQSKDNHMYQFLSIGIWEYNAPEELKNVRCKKCVTNSVTCNSILDSIQGIDRCDGKFTIFWCKIKHELIYNT